MAITCPRLDIQGLQESTMKAFASEARLGIGLSAEDRSHNT
jgi:hypothetical protein